MPPEDNFYAALNSAVFLDNSFVFVPKGVRCSTELSTYFGVNACGKGRFEHTLIVAEEGASVSDLEGCSMPMRDENQLHAALVELVALNDASIKYLTVQNWYPGDAEGRGSIYNFVTKRGACRGARSRISWTQAETGFAITWKYPSCILQGADSVVEFIPSPSRWAPVGGHGHEDDPPRPTTRSTIVSKDISAGQRQNTYRGLVRVMPKASDARSFTRCDSLLIGDRCRVHTVHPILHRGAATTPRALSTRPRRRAWWRTSSSTDASAASPRRRWSACSSTVSPARC